MAQSVTYKIEETEKYLSKYYKNDIRFNTVSNEVEIKFKDEKDFTPLKDREFNDLKKSIIAKGIHINDGNLKTVLNSSFVPNHDPFKEYLNGLPKWDGKTEYIMQLCNTLKCTNQEFVSWSLIRWVIAVVASLMEDGVTNHEVPILVGKQGIGKSTWIRGLVPESLKPHFYSGTINPNNKDTLHYLASCMFIDLDELSNLNRKETTRIKELITKEQIKMRLPYGKTSLNFTRKASFIGSINDSKFLHDLTGTRRFLCYELTDIDKDHKIDINMVYSEALARYKNKEKYWFDGADIGKINTNNEQFRVVPIIEIMIQKEYDIPKSEDVKEVIEYLTATDVAYRFNCKTAAVVQQIGRILTKLGYESVKHNGIKKYKLVKISRRK